MKATATIVTAASIVVLAAPTAQAARTAHVSRTAHTAHAALTKPTFIPPDRDAVWMASAKRKVCVIKRGDAWIRITTKGKCPTGAKR
jgi:hypothetical protein